MPKPLKVAEEAKIEMRRELHSKIFNDFFTNKTKEGDQIQNLSPAELRGLKSLLKRIRAGELLIILTDKSSRFCVVSVEDYLKMGEVHTANDIIVNREEIDEIEKRLNGHSVSWVKIFQTGLDHNTQTE